MILLTGILVLLRFAKFIDSKTAEYSPSIVCVKIQQKELVETIMLFVECVSGITVLLSLIVFQLIVADKVPESSHSVPVIGIHCYTSQFLLSLFQFLLTERQAIGEVFLCRNMHNISKIQKLV